MSKFRLIRRGAGGAAPLALPRTMVAACSSGSGSTTTAGGGGGSTASSGAGGIKKGLTVYFIPKDTQNPYEVLADKGGQQALQELGGKVVVSSGTADTAAAQIPSIQAAIQAHADAIVIAGNDPSALW